VIWTIAYSVGAVVSFPFIVSYAADETREISPLTDGDRIFLVCWGALAAVVWIFTLPIAFIIFSDRRDSRVVSILGGALRRWLP